MNQLILNRCARSVLINPLFFCEFSGADPGSTAEEDAAWYERYKLVHGIADGPEIANRIPLECNLDLLHYISFHKGCYVGQELTARTKFKVKMLFNIVAHARRFSAF